jgi:hypothetical protein
MKSFFLKSSGVKLSNHKMVSFESVSLYNTPSQHPCMCSRSSAIRFPILRNIYATRAAKMEVYRQL